jgi:hypothetical protein
VDIDTRQSAAVVAELETVSGKARGVSAYLSERAEYVRVMTESIDWLGGFNVLRARADPPDPAWIEPTYQGIQVCDSSESALSVAIFTGAATQVQARRRRYPV